MAVAATLRHLFGEYSAGDVGEAAGGESDHQFDGPRGILVLRPGNGWAYSEAYCRYQSEHRENLFL
ncbi:MAG: hypothetical protein HYU31_06325 [Deltaproteobacteria bacterium]|nr:hypothetical protein [Deltaproteobacteria bacterium]